LPVTKGSFMLLAWRNKHKERIEELKIWRRMAS
jgi:hypothetical protein